MSKFEPLHRPRTTLLTAAFFSVALTALAEPPVADSTGAGLTGAAATSPALGAPPAGTAPAPTASQSGNAAQADELRRRGNDAWDEGRYADALVDYEEAERLSHDPKIFYNLGNTYPKVGRNAEALAWLLRYKAAATRADLAQTPNLEKRIAALRNQVTLLKVNVNVAGAQVLVRGALVGTKQADKQVEVSLNEGKAPIEIISEGYLPYRKEHTLRGGSSLEIEVQLHQRASPTTVGEQTKTVYVSTTPFWSQWWFWAGAGVLIAGGAATVYGLSTEKEPGTGSIGRVVSPLGTRAHGLGLRF